MSTEVAALIKAICYNELDVVLDSSLSNANMADDDGCTLLHWAALNNRIGIATLLLEKGANVNVVGGVLQETPLMWAIRRRFYSMMELLFSRGADLQHKNINGCDALHLACMNTETDSLQGIYLLLHWGAEVNTVNSQGEAPIFGLLRRLQQNQTKDASLSSTEATMVRNAIRLLLKHGESPLNVDVHGNLPLHLLARHGGYLDLALALDIYLHPGCEHAHSIRNADGHNPYTLARRCENQLMAQMLFDAMMFKFLPPWWPTALAAFTFVAVFSIFNSYSWLAAAFMCGLLVSAVFFWGVQWQLIKNRSRASVGVAIGFATVLAQQYASLPTVSLFSSATGLVLLAVACIVSIRFNHTKPDIVLNQRNEIIAGIIGSSPIGTEEEAPRTEGPRICPVCISDKRTATLHCLFCGNCVKGQDFHSFFFGNCVGAGNRRLYYGAVFLWMLVNAHFIMVAPWRTGAPLVTLACVWCGLSCASLIWLAVVLVTRQTTVHLMSRGVMSPTLPTMQQALSRLASFLRDGGYEIEAGNVHIFHPGGGPVVLHSDAILKFLLSTFHKPSEREQSEDDPEASQAEQMHLLFYQQLASGLDDEGEYGVFDMRKTAKGCEKHDCDHCHEGRAEDSQDATAAETISCDER